MAFYFFIYLFFPDAGTVAAFLGTLLFPPSCFFIFFAGCRDGKEGLGHLILALLSSGSKYFFYRSVDVAIHKNRLEK